MTPRKKLIIPKFHSLAIHKELKIAVFCVLLLILQSCKKDSGNSNSDPNNPQNTIGSGKFSIAGKNYTGMCTATPAAGIGNNGVDVGIVNENGDAFAIVNLSTASSGTTAFEDGWYQPSGKTSAVISVASPFVYMATKPGGSITKTGSKTFTFSCNVYDITDGKEYAVTGSGNYK